MIVLLIHNLRLDLVRLIKQIQGSLKVVEDRSNLHSERPESCVLEGISRKLWIRADAGHQCCLPLSLLCHMRLYLRQPAIPKWFLLFRTATAASWRPLLVVFAAPRAEGAHLGALRRPRPRACCPRVPRLRRPRTLAAREPNRRHRAVGCALPHDRHRAQSAGPQLASAAHYINCITAVIAVSFGFGAGGANSICDALPLMCF